VVGGGAKPGVGAAIAKSGTASSGRAGAPSKPRALHLKRVALVGKSTRLDRVGSQALDACDALAARLRNAHMRHSSAIDDLGRALALEGMHVTHVGIQNVNPDALAGSDLVICAGGDGTFLSTAAHVPAHVPVLGVNTDPERSTGALTALSYVPDEGGADAIKNALERLRRGNYELVARKRLVVSIRPVGGSEYILPRLALNDVFVSERNSGRVYACEMTADTGPIRIRRSSGLILCTGTGSGARLRNQMRVDATFVRHVLDEAAARGAVSGVVTGARADERSSAWLTDSECISIAESWSRRWELAPDDGRMVYSILEPMVPDCLPRSCAGFANWMVIKSLGHNTVLTLDGFYEHPIRYGDELTVAVGNDESAVLSVQFPAHDIYVPRRGRAWRDF
jgi:NAD+ kinase